MSRLYELSARYANLLALLDQQEVPECMIIDALHEVQEEFQAKAVSIAKIIRNLESDQEQLEEEAKRLTQKAKVLGRRIEGLKGYCLREMQRLDLRKVTGVVTLAVQKNPPAVNVIDPDAVPAAYRVRQPDTLNRATIRDALKNGVVVPGCRLTQTESLRVH